MSTKKTEVTKVHNNRNSSQIQIGDVIKQTTKFCYLGTTVSYEG
jgi:hypothetical protein